jgi:hypothetical protein
MLVKISVRGGVVCCDEIPSGIQVQITDYDVQEVVTDQRDEHGEACSRWTVPVAA